MLRQAIKEIGEKVGGGNEEEVVVVDSGEKRLSLK